MVGLGFREELGSPFPSLPNPSVRSPTLPGGPPAEVVLLAPVGQPLALVPPLHLAARPRGPTRGKGGISDRHQERRGVGVWIPADPASHSILHHRAVEPQLSFALISNKYAKIRCTPSFKLGEGMLMGKKVNVGKNHRILAQKNAIINMQLPSKRRHACNLQTLWQGLTGPPPPLQNSSFGPPWLAQSAGL